MEDRGWIVVLAFASAAMAEVGVNVRYGDEYIGPIGKPAYAGVSTLETQGRVALWGSERPVVEVAACVGLGYGLDGEQSPKLDRLQLTLLSHFQADIALSLLNHYWTRQDTLIEGFLRYVDEDPRVGGRFEGWLGVRQDWVMLGFEDSSGTDLGSVGTRRQSWELGAKFGKRAVPMKGSGFAAGFEGSLGFALRMGQSLQGELAVDDSTNALVTDKGTVVYLESDPASMVFLAEAGYGIGYRSSWPNGWLMVQTGFGGHGDAEVSFADISLPGQAGRWPGVNIGSHRFGWNVYVTFSLAL